MGRGKRLSSNDKTRKKYERPTVKSEKYLEEETLITSEFSGPACQNAQGTPEP